MTLVYLGIGWLLGLTVAAACPLKWPIWLALSFLPITAAIIQREQRAWWRLVLALAFAFLGAARYASSRPHFDAESLASYNDRGWGEFEGFVAAEPEPVREELTQAVVMVERMRLEGEAWRAVSGRVLLEAPRYPSLRYGDRLRFDGRLETPWEWADSANGGYLARRGIYSQMRQARLERLEVRAGSPLMRILLDLKTRVEIVVRQILPDPEASLLSGILLGRVHGIPELLMNDFNDTGTSHIIAISGFNFNILASMLFSTLRRWSRRQRAGFLTLGVVVAYACLIGGEASVVRAAIMGSMMVIGGMLGRATFAPASLMAATIGMTAVNPTLLWDIGFQLSFAATLGLMLYAEPLKTATLSRLMRVCRWEQENWFTQALNDGFLITVAAQIVTLPLIIYHFGRLSLISLLANLLVLPIQPLLMGLSGMATAAGLIALPLGKAGAWLSYPTLWWTIRVAETLAQIPGASVEVKLPLAGLAAIYLFLLVMTIGLSRWGDLSSLGKRFAGRWAVWVSLTAAGVSVITAISAIRGLPDGRLHVTFLDVGEGEAILIRSPEGRRILVDGGPDPSVLLAHLGRELSFWERTLDLVIATHPDGEHVNGLPAVLDRYRVERVITNGERDGPSAWIELLAQVETKEIPHVTALRRQTISTGDGVVLEVLHPDGRSGERLDGNAIVLRLRYGDAAFMLTSDAGEEVESELIEAGLPLASTVLKVADSGDRDGTSWAFLEAVAPELIVISVGEPVGNPHHHPAVRVLERVETWNCAVSRTDRQGTIRLTTDGNELWIETDR